MVFENTRVSVSSLELARIVPLLLQWFCSTLFLYGDSFKAMFKSSIQAKVSIFRQTTLGPYLDAVAIAMQCLP